MEAEKRTTGQGVRPRRKATISAPHPLSSLAATLCMVVPVLVAMLHAPILTHNLILTHNCPIGGAAMGKEPQSPRIRIYVTGNPLIVIVFFLRMCHSS